MNHGFSPNPVFEQASRELTDRQGHVYRGVRTAFVEPIRRIVELARARDWFSHGLIPTSVAGLQLEGYPLVLEHQRIPFATLPAEWPAQALRKAALRYLELTLAVSGDGYGLRAPETARMLFAGTTPYVTNIGAIRPLHGLNQEEWFRDFNTGFMVPLMLFAEGQFGLARNYLRETTGGVGTSLASQDPARLVRGPLVSSGYSSKTLEALRRQISDMVFPGQGGEWHTYVQLPKGELRLKDRQVRAELEKLSFKTAIDIGTNRGVHSFMCADRGATVLACDIEESCLNDMFKAAEASAADVLPLHLDLVRPIGATGAFGAVAPQQERLRCDLVLALALIHHLSLRQQFYPAAVIDAIVAHTNDAALIEFVPLDDWHVAQWKLPPPDGYSLEAVEAMLRAHFEHVEHVPIEPDPRRMFVCRGKRAQ